MPKNKRRAASFATVQLVQRIRNKPAALAMTASGLVAFIGAFIGAFLLVRKFRQLSEESKIISACGYTPELPTQKDLAFLRRMTTFIVTVQVGAIEVRGAEILASIPCQRPREPNSVPRLIATADQERSASADGISSADREASTNEASAPAIFVCNHTHYADPAVVPLVINRPARYMPAVGVMHFAWGMGAHFISKPMAAIPVQILPGQGGPAREAAVDALTSGDTIVIFPEGWAYQDGKPGPYKKGVAQIAIEATKRLKKPIPIIPIFVRYGRYPGKWVSKLGPPWEYFCMLFGAWYYRRGAVAVIGAPFSSTDLPADVDAATDLIRRKVQELDPGRV